MMVESESMDTGITDKPGRLTVIALALALGACTYTPPPGPRVMVMPGPGRTLEQFQKDDGYCRSYAQTATGYVPPAAAAQQSAVASGVVGTLVGAAAGALLGAAAHNPAAGTALGAGTGLLVGSAAGSNAANESAEMLQQRYDTAYLQCMAAAGNSVPSYYYPR
jgi:Glycine-zipper domain